jgi:hypothetical protein
MAVFEMLAIVILVSTNAVVGAFVSKEKFKSEEACLAATKTEKYTSVVENLEAVLPDDPDVGGPVTVVLQCRISEDEKAAVK